MLRSRGISAEGPRGWEQPEGGPSGGDAVEEAETADQDAEDARDAEDPLRSLAGREESLIKKSLMVPHAA